MATIEKCGPGQWRVKVREKGYQQHSRTFTNKARTERWARRTENKPARRRFLVKWNKLFPGESFAR